MPVRLKVLRRIRGGQLLDQTRDNNPHLPFRFNEPSKVAAKIQVVGSKVLVCVHAHDGIEELVREGQTMGFCVDGKYPVLKAGFADSLPVLAGRDPQIGAHTCRSNSWARNMELMAVPQPRSGTRIPGFRAITWLRDSVSHRTLGPIMFLMFQSVSYCADRGNSVSLNACANSSFVRLNGHFRMLSLGDSS